MEKGGIILLSLSFFAFDVNNKVFISHATIVWKNGCTITLRKLVSLEMYRYPRIYRSVRIPRFLNKFRVEREREVWFSFYRLSCPKEKNILVLHVGFRHSRENFHVSPTDYSSRTARHFAITLNLWQLRSVAYLPNYMYLR